MYEYVAIIRATCPANLSSKLKHMTSSQVNVKKGAEQAPYMTSISATTESVAVIKYCYLSWKILLEMHRLLTFLTIWFLFSQWGH